MTQEVDRGKTYLLPVPDKIELSQQLITMPGLIRVMSCRPQATMTRDSPLVDLNI